MNLKNISTNRLLTVICVLIILIAGYVVLKLFLQTKNLESFIEGASVATNTTMGPTTATIMPIQDQINALSNKVAVLQASSATKGDIANNLVKGAEYTQKINGKTVSKAQISLN